VTPSRAYFSLPGDETRSGAQDLRRGLRHSARSNRRGLRPRIKGSVALLRRMEASIVGCDDQLVHLRSVPCEMRPENIFQIYDEQRLVGEDADLYHNGDMLSALGVHVVNGWARAHP